MRGEGDENGPCYSFFDVEQRLLQDHPLWIIKALIDPVLKRHSPASDEMYSWTGRPTIPPAGQGGEPHRRCFTWL